MASETEAELMQRVAGGDQTAYTVILDAQLPSISRFTRRMMGNSAEAEDITQEVFLRLWTHADRFNPAVAKLSTWLHNIAHNLCIDYFRKHKRLVPWTGDSDKSEDNQAGGIEPDMAFLSRIDAENVKRSIMALPERQRSAILLCHYQGLSNKDAALILDVSVDALESLLARGRKKLRALLSEGVPVE